MKFEVMFTVRKILGTLKSDFGLVLLTWSHVGVTCYELVLNLGWNCLIGHFLCDGLQWRQTNLTSLLVGLSDPPKTWLGRKNKSLNSYVIVFQPIPGNYCKINWSVTLKLMAKQYQKTIIKKVLYLLNKSNNNINKIWSQSQLLPKLKKNNWRLSEETGGCDLLVLEKIYIHLKLN